MKAPEVKIIQNIQDKLAEQFPHMLDLATEEFEELHDDVLESPHIGQLFYSWLFTEFCLVDGKNIPSLCFEALTLTNDERTLLHNIQNALHGIFEILGIKDKVVSVRDLLTNKTYQVMTMDMDPLPRGTCIEASLAKNLKGDYFFFGGFYFSDNKEIVRWNLLEYSRDLTLDEQTERELGIIRHMEALGGSKMLSKYLDEGFGMRAKEAKTFLRLNEKQRKDILKAILSQDERSEDSEEEK